VFINQSAKCVAVTNTVTKVILSSWEELVWRHSLLSLAIHLLEMKNLCAYWILIFLYKGKTKLTVYVHLPCIVKCRPCSFYQLGRQYNVGGPVCMLHKWLWASVHRELDEFGTLLKFALFRLQTGHLNGQDEFSSCPANSSNLVWTEVWEGLWKRQIACSNFLSFSHSATF
jgi:hypothetical protein